mgnify:CR=1 FL=1
MVFKLLYSLIKKISLKQTRLFVNTSAMITDNKKKFIIMWYQKRRHTSAVIEKILIKINYLYLKKIKNL